MARPRKRAAVLDKYVAGLRQAVPQADIEVLDKPSPGADFLVWVEVPEGLLMEAVDVTSSLTTDLYLKFGVYVDVRVGEKEPASSGG